MSTLESPAAHHRIHSATQWEGAMHDAGLMLSVRLAPSVDRRLPSRLRSMPLGEMSLVDMASGPIAATRTAKAISRSSERRMAAMLVREGTEVVRLGETAHAISPGDLLLWDSTRPTAFTIPDHVRKMFLLVPENDFTAACGADQLSASGVRLIKRTPGTRLLETYLAALTREAPHLLKVSADCARTAALELLAGAVHSDGSPTSAQSHPALRASIEAWIDATVDESSITPAQAAAAHAVSVRTVHRAFADDDSFAAVVRTRRLLRARQDLDTTDHSVATIAARWGFSDASHLARSFKQQLGMSPAEYRRNGRGSNPAAAP